MLAQFPPSRNTRLATFWGIFSRFGTDKRAVTVKKRYPVKAQPGIACFSWDCPRGTDAVIHHSSISGLRTPAFAARFFVKATPLRWGLRASADLLPQSRSTKNVKYIQYSRIFHTFACVKTLAESPCPIMRCCPKENNAP